MKAIFVRKTEQAIYITGPAGNVYTRYPLENFSKNKDLIEIFFNELETYQNQNYKIIFEH